MQEVAQKRWGINDISQDIKLPFKDGNTKLDKKTGQPYDGYADNLFIDLTTTNGQPANCYDEQNQPLQPSQVYAGCYVQCYVTPCASEPMGIRTISFKLAMVKKMADGPRLGNAAMSADPNVVFSGTAGAPAGMPAGQAVNPAMPGQQLPAAQPAVVAGQPPVANAMPTEAAPASPGQQPVAAPAPAANPQITVPPQQPATVPGVVTSTPPVAPPADQLPGQAAVAQPAVAQPAVNPVGAAPALPTVGNTAPPPLPQAGVSQGGIAGGNL